MALTLDPAGALTLCQSTYVETTLQDAGNSGISGSWMLPQNLRCCLSCIFRFPGRTRCCVCRTFTGQFRGTPIRESPGQAGHGQVDVVFMADRAPLTDRLTGRRVRCDEDAEGVSGGVSEDDEGFVDVIGSVRQDCGS